MLDFRRLLPFILFCQNSTAAGTDILIILQLSITPSPSHPDRFLFLLLILLLLKFCNLPLISNVARVCRCCSVEMLLPFCIDAFVLKCSCCFEMTLLFGNAAAILNCTCCCEIMLLF